MKFATKAIHEGLEADPSTGAVMTPIYQTSTYVQDQPGAKYDYSRAINPTRSALERNLAGLENGNYGISFASGMSAIEAVIHLLEPGDEVISTNDLYGGTYRLFTQVYAKYGIKFHFIDTSDHTEIENYINDKTKLIWVETPTNPVLRLTDIEKTAQIARKHGCWLCCDNTFASPYLQTPMDLGADLVVHSATKYLGGHSDVVLGAVVCNDDALADQVYFFQKSCGAIPGPNDCFLVLRGIKTLHLRMKQHCANAYEVAHFLRGHDRVAKVSWPGFEDHKQYDIAIKQMRDFGGMVSFILRPDNYDDALKLMQNTALFSFAESLGGVESLIGHPASMTHGSIPKKDREKVGITDSFMRVSVGVEDPEDLVHDLQHAIEKL